MVHQSKQIHYTTFIANRITNRLKTTCCSPSWYWSAKNCFSSDCWLTVSCHHELGRSRIKVKKNATTPYPTSTLQPFKHCIRWKDCERIHDSEHRKLSFISLKLHPLGIRCVVSQILMTRTAGLHSLALNQKRVARLSAPPFLTSFYEYDHITASESSHYFSLHRISLPMKSPLHLYNNPFKWFLWKMNAFLIVLMFTMKPPRNPESLADPKQIICWNLKKRNITHLGSLHRSNCEKLKPNPVNVLAEPFEFSTVAQR